MRTVKLLAVSAAAAGFVGFSGVAGAATLSNGMTNVAQAVASCDIVAIGIDFGKYNPLLGNATVAVTNPNTATNAVAASRVDDAHPRKNKDGAAGSDGSAAYYVGATETMDDAFSVTLAGRTTDLSAVVAAGSGIYAICVGDTITRVDLIADGGAGATTQLTGVAVSYASTLKRLTTGADTIGTGAEAASLNYTINFEGVASPALPAALPVGAVSLVAYTAVGNIPASQNAPEGYYSETIEAEMTY